MRKEKPDGSSGSSHSASSSQSTSKPERTSQSVSRRRFTKTLAAAVVAAPVIATASRAQTPPAAKEATAPPKPQTTPAQAAQTPPKPSPLAEAYAQAALIRFGEHMTPEQKETLSRDMEGNVRTADRLRAFKLQNSDEPDFVFAA